jgi:hypothetical protein
MLEPPHKSANETSECWAGKWRGIAENAAEIEAITRCSYEQGLAVRKLSPEDLFPPEDLFHKSTFEMSRI